MRHIGLVIFLLCGLGCAAFGASPSAAAKHARVEVIKPLALVSGEHREIKISILVDSGFHIQSNPASTPQLIATVVEMEKLAGVELGKPIYPPGKNYRLQGAPTDIATYEGRVEIGLPIVVKTKPSANVWKGKIRYQACNAQTCFFPVWEDFAIVLK